MLSRVLGSVSLLGRVMVLRLIVLLMSKIVNSIISFSVFVL